MTISESKCVEIALKLDNAYRDNQDLTMFTPDVPDLKISDAYKIQQLNVAHRLQRGEKIIGMKMGLTSHAKMQQMNVDEPIYGILTDEMQVGSAATIKANDFIHPKIEPEIAFVISQDINGPVDYAQAKAAVSGVCAAMEIIDSRFTDFKFTLKDVIADNTSASKFIIQSEPVAIDNLDIANLGIVMYKNDEVLATGAASAILDDPINALKALINMIVGQDRQLKKGDIVLAGAATAAYPFNAGDIITTKVQNVGEVSIKID